MIIRGVVDVFSYDVSQADLMKYFPAPVGLKAIALPLTVVVGKPNHVQILLLEDGNPFLKQSPINDTVRA